MPAGSELYRLFFPEPYATTALSFRRYGPLGRFDHHGGTTRRGRRAPAEDPERGIYYAASTLSGCLVEVFGDDAVVEPEGCVLTLPRTLRSLRLLDLRGKGAMRAGANASVSKTERAAISQAWSRFFYERADYYGEVDGLIYSNAHNDEAAFALYERCRDALECPESEVIPLDDEAIRPEVQMAALENNMGFEG